MNDRKHLVFCFSYAGGTSDFFNNLEKACDSSIHFVKLEYSGHGTRMKEPLYNSFEEMTNDLFPMVMDVVKQYPNCGYSLIGYSMGSIAVFDMLRRIESTDDIKNPCNVFLAAHQPKAINSLSSVSLLELDKWVKERTIEFGAIDEKLKDNEIFWRVYLPIFRSDYVMIANYAFDRVAYKTVVPAVIFYSEEDTPFEEMKEWNKYFVGKCDFVKYSGSHFFIKNHNNDMAKIISERINCAGEK